MIDNRDLDCCWFDIYYVIGCFIELVVVSSRVFRIGDIECFSVYFGVGGIVFLYIFYIWIICDYYVVSYGFIY